VYRRLISTTLEDVGVTAIASTRGLPTGKETPATNNRPSP
jgi:hypothetical protein